MTTYKDYLIKRSQTLKSDQQLHAIDRLAYKVSQGEFQGITFNTPNQLLQELSKLFLLSEELEKAINFSAIMYIEYLHYEQ